MISIRKDYATNHRILNPASLLAFTLICIQVTATARADCSIEPIEKQSQSYTTFPQEIPGGQVRLCIKDRSISAWVELEGDVRRRSVYSAWWLYVDQPSACEPGMDNAYYACIGEAYVWGEHPAGVIGRLDATIGRPDKALRLRGALPGFVPALGSEVVVLVIDHGPIKRRDSLRSARQLMTPENSDWGEPQLGNDVDWLRQPFPFVVALSRHVIE